MASTPFHVGDFARLLDDAAVFPPGNASVPDAVASHLQRRDRGWGVLVGPLVVAGPHLPDLIKALDEGEVPARPLGVSFVVRDLSTLPDLVGGVLGDRRLLLASIEIVALGLPLTQDALARMGDVPEGVTVYLEPGWGDDLRGCIEVIAAAGRRVKLRTGGTDASAFPDPQTLAEAVSAAWAAGVVFKATAGLHNAVRHRDPVTSFEHHGYLNLLLAASVAALGVPASQAALEIRDPAVLSREVLGLGREGLAQVRAGGFTSFGTCDVREPYDDLIALGLLEPIGD